MRWTTAIGSVLAMLAAPALAVWGQQGAVTPKGKSAPAGGSARPEAASQAKAAPEPAPDPQAQARLDALLAAWEKQSAKVQTLDASYYRIDKSAVLGDITVYHGRAMLKAPFIACLNTETVKVDAKTEMKLVSDAIQWERQAPAERVGPDPIPKTKRELYDRIVCTGETVFHFDAAAKQIFEYPLSQEDREAALQQGPLRFLFNMKRDDVLKRYHMRVVGEDDRVWQIQIVPKLDIDRNAFAQAVLVLRKTTFLPESIVLQEPNNNTQRFFLTQVTPNQPINDINFTPQLDAWKRANYEVVKNPPPGAQAPRGNTPATKVANPAPGGATKAAAQGGTAPTPAKGARR